MSQALKLLLVEDSENDAELLLYELRRYGYDATHDRVYSEGTLRSALAAQSWDIVLCDHGLPSFSSAEALRVVLDTAPGIPFVILSGTIGEEAAVEALKTGARDVVLKQNLARLGPVVDRELREVANRREHEQLERDRAELETRLIQSQKLDAIGRLAAGIAHDYRNLLSVVLGFSHLALQQLSEEHPAYEHIVQIRDAGHRAIGLTDQLLTFSRAQDSAAELVDVNAMIGQLEPMLRQLIGEDIELRTTLTAGVSRVYIDPRRLEQVIVNLAANARDAMPQGGTLTLETAGLEVGEEGSPATDEVPRPGPHVRLTVADTGTGIDAKTRARLFEPFFTTKPPDRGTGLGLATSYGIVKQADGFITVESEPDHGAAFHVQLPAVNDAAEPAAAPPLEPRLPATGTETVLIVDDNGLLRRVIEEALTSTGYVTLAAADGAEAIALSESHPEIDLLITDIMMPGMRGTELARKLVAAHPQLRVLYMSAQSPRPDWGLEEVDAVTEFIAKPFALPAFASRVREILDR